MAVAVSVGYSGMPLSKKLGIKERSRVATFGAPPDFADLVAPLPAGVRLKEGPRGRGPFDVIAVFVRTEAELGRRFDTAARLLDPAGGLWIGWPKQSSSFATDLRGSHVRAYGLGCGLVDNKICAIDADWSGLRFVVRLENRPGRRG